MKIWTVGHSTHAAERFHEILLAHAIETIVDVRTFPASRRHPQFNQAQLAASLESVGIHYLHNPQLGGRRKPTDASKNTAWQNASFRAYADHMETAEFHNGIEKLLEVARKSSTAVMCAESLWWRCHRSLISDYLKSIGVEVIHILDEKKAEVHPYTSAARIIDGELSYAGLLP